MKTFDETFDTFDTFDTFETCYAKKDTDVHFRKWYATYRDHLDHMYNLFCQFSDISIQCDFETFVSYVYNASSGLIY